MRLHRSHNLSNLSAAALSRRIGQRDKTSRVEGGAAVGNSLFAL